MRYKIVNITNAYLTLEPPSLMKRGAVEYREYSVIPDRVQYLKEKGLIEIVPVGDPSIDIISTSSEKDNLKVINSVQPVQLVDPVKSSAKAVLPDLKNYSAVPFIESNKVEFVDILSLFK